MEFRGNVLLLLQSFLLNRKHRTALIDRASTWGNASAGVPKGSILGPVLFLIYVNDLTEKLKCSVKLFADDTSIFTVVQDINLAASHIDHDHDQFAFWAHNWRVSFNPDSLM